MTNASTCFFPDGTVAPRDTPCHDPFLRGGASACCAESDVCLDNNLCLAQSGPEIITRGSCTDWRWLSPECPQYCPDVEPSNGCDIHVAYTTPDHVIKFCCNLGIIVSNNTCYIPTKGSAEPFSVDAGLVIYNRTSGSTSPNITDTVTTTIIATKTTTVPVTTSPPPISSSSSERHAAIAASMSALLGAAFLISLIFLWQQGKGAKASRKEAQDWKAKYLHLFNAKTLSSPLDVSDSQSVRELRGGNRLELDGQMHGAYQLEGRQVNEMEGTQASSFTNERGHVRYG
ncbi:hypothetical protein BDR22DRAFT_885099 [Usnea florida]